MFPHSSQKVFPEDIQCVLDPSGNKGGIYISNVEAAQNVRTLRKFGIGAVLTAAFNIQLDHNKEDVPLYKHIPGKDHEQYDLSKHFEEAVEFIHKALGQTNILVHCMAGVSRSVTLVIAFLISKRGMSFDEAFSMIKSRRRIIHPNQGFISQLRTYQGQCRFSRSASPTKAHNSFQTRRSLKQYESPEKDYSSLLRRYESPMKNYESPTKQHYEPAHKSRYQSPSRRYQPSPLHSSNNIYAGNVERASLRGLSGIKHINRTTLSRKEDYLEMRIADIRKKYSNPEQVTGRGRHAKSKSIMENTFSSKPYYGGFESTMPFESSLSRLTMRKLSSMYDHRKY